MSISPAHPDPACPVCGAAPSPQARDPQLCAPCDRAVTDDAIDELNGDVAALRKRATAAERDRDAARAALADARAIVAALAACDPAAYESQGDTVNNFRIVATCALCGNVLARDKEPALHAPTCPWRRAREVTARGAGDGEAGR